MAAPSPCLEVSGDRSPSCVPPFPAPRVLTGLYKGILGLLEDGFTHAHTDHLECARGVRLGRACRSEPGPLLSPIPALSCSVPQRTLLPQPAPCQQRLYAAHLQLGPKSSLDISLRPRSGLLGPGAHKVLLTYTYPQGSSWKQHVFYLQFNSCPQYLKVGSWGGDWILGRGPESGASLFKAASWD